MTSEQTQWVNTLKAFVNQRPSRAAKVPRNPCIRLLYDMVHSTAFEALITTFIVLVVLAMACDYWGIEHDGLNAELYTQAMTYCAYVFYFECALKLAALGVGGYFYDGWNRFDFFLVVTSFLNQVGSPQPQPLPEPSPQPEPEL